MNLYGTDVRKPMIDTDSNIEYDLKAKFNGSGFELE